MELSELCRESHRISKLNGFWDEKTNIAEKLMLIVTELSEACEADRTGDKKGFEVELADTFIRLADLCGYLNIDIENIILGKAEINKERPYKHGKRY